MVLVLFMGAAFHRHVQGLPWSYRLCMASVFVISIHLTGQFSVLGSQLETLLVFGSVALGELLGRSVSSGRLELTNARLQDQVNYEKALRASDSRLNHIIKGHCGGARLSLELIEAIQPTSQMSAETQRVFADCKQHLAAAIEWCHHRQCFIRIESGTYRNTLAPWPVEGCIRQALIGVDTHTLDIEASVTDVVRVDTFVMRLVLDEAIANVRRYAEPGSPLEISVALRPAATAPPDVVLPAAHATADECAGGLFLCLAISSTNAKGVPQLSADALSHCFDAGYVAHSVSSTSDGLGLDSVAKAVRAVHGHVSLSSPLGADGKVRTVLHVALPAEPVDEPSQQELVVPPPRPMLRPQSSLPSVAATLSPALPVAQPDEAVLPKMGFDGAVRRLRCLGIDDCTMQRQLHLELFEHILHADMRVSWAVGSTEEELECFVDLALGRLSQDLRPLPIGGELPAADVVLIDQNMIIADTGVTANGKHWRTLLGTTLAAELRRHGFGGVVCLYTALSAAEGLSMGSMPGVDLVIFKGEVSPKEFGELIRSELAKTRAQYIGSTASSRVG